MSLTNKHHGMINLIQERVKSNNASQVNSSTNTNTSTSTIIFIEDIVPNVLFGFNQRVFTLGTNSTFHGVKDIPVGMHFVYAGAGVLSVRNGFWFVIEGGDERIHVRSWDSNNETLEDVSELESDEKRRKMVGIYSSSIYPFGTTWTKEMSNAQSEGHHARWTALTSCITSTLLSRITGHERNHWKVTSSDDVLDTPHMATNGAKATQTAITTDQNLYFSLEQGSKTFLNTATGRDRTQQALDTTAYIVDAIMNKCTEQDEDEIIGELQFSFLSGMLLGNIAVSVPQHVSVYYLTCKLVSRAVVVDHQNPVSCQRTRPFTSYIRSKVHTDFSSADANERARNRRFNLRSRRFGGESAESQLDQIQSTPFRTRRFKCRHRSCKAGFRRTRELSRERDVLGAG